MLKELVAVLAGTLTCLGGDAKAELSAGHQGPATETLDISAPAMPGNGLSDCRLTGQVILWTSRPAAVLDDMRENLGAVEAGLVQFGAGSKLERCVPDGAALDLSDRFANFLVADDRGLRRGSFARTTAGAFASQLAQDFYHLAEPDGTLIPLVDGLRTSAIGSVSYRFTIVLIRSAKSGSFDAVIHRETVGTKFASRLTESDRCLSRMKWSSIQ
jgi:hypothetical protein